MSDFLSTLLAKTLAMLVEALVAQIATLAVRFVRDRWFPVSGPVAA
ncbi:hypothetical protein NI17_021365 [Thermobifida halotolerans]|uniref:Uncharacterized protein n=1 Tax=Thermobifida halotolerans TaxID=483545 RepID=A0AA97LWH9_9ACTN|nr:hypothetical protein [Thermobifida halotolerans]UOE19261.1 hypothetical protein NI17_021365 [Thermobifida halotolerans]